jgi:diguanylate cyclase (GGDEF)-like protein/PAS domain S-box-containing protein
MKFSGVAIHDGSPRQVGSLDSIAQFLIDHRSDGPIENILQQLPELALAIASAPNFEATLAVTLQRICQVTGWQYGEVWLPGIQTEILVCSPVWYASNPSYWYQFRQVTETTHFKRNQGLPGRVWATQQPEWIPHVHLEIKQWFCRTTVGQQVGLRSGLGVPIVADGEVLAVLIFFMLENRQENEELVALVSTLATQIGTVVQRKRAEAALQTSEASLQSLFDSLPGIVFRAGPGPDWKMEYLSCGCEELTGYASQELIGSNSLITYNDLTHPEDLPRVLRAIQDVTMQQCSYVVEYRIHNRSGEERWVWEKGFSRLDTQGNVVGLDGFITDVTDRKRAEEALRSAEAKYRSIFENAVEGIFQSTPEGKYCTVNPMLAQMYGYDSPQDLIRSMGNIGKQLYIDPEARETFIRLVEKQGMVRGFEAQIRRRDGEIIWISECARAIRDQSGAILGYEGTVQDISDRKRAEAELQRRDVLLEGLAAATQCLLTNPNFAEAVPIVLQILGEVAEADRVYLYENHPHSQTGEIAMSMRFEWVRSGIAPSIGQTHWQNQPYRTLGMERWYQAFSAGQLISGKVKAFPPSEQVILERDGIQAILMVPVFVDEVLWGYMGFDACRKEQVWSSGEQSLLVTIAASLAAALKRQQTEQAMKHQAFHDNLTGLPNRMLFNHRLPAALAHARRTGEYLAVLFLDLDRFKTINDSLGHSIGDRLLKEATARLLESIREEDTIARWGGDEFTLCLPNLKSAEDAAKVSQRILTALQPPFTIESHELHITASIGIALYPQDGEDLQTLLINADAALYRVKEEGRNHYQFYCPGMNAQTSHLLSLEQDLYNALERKQFQIYYQPRLDAITGEILQMEALLRWHHPEQGFISPQTFIPLAEANGLMVPIGEWVLRSACIQLRAWQDQGLPLMGIAVNLSPRQFQSSALLQSIRQILQDAQLDPTHLELEITETTVMKDVEFAQAILAELKNMGVRLALDDFGTGYSSLVYLKQFPLHTLKVDRTFVQGLPQDPQDMAIVSTVVALGQGLGLQVVAEGVETVEQLNCLRSLNCQEIQGNFFSPALPVEEATILLKDLGLGTNANLS